jgi:hypothetical protein
MLQVLLDMLAPGVAVVEGEEVARMGQGMVQGGDLAQALGMAKQVDPVEVMLVEVEEMEGAKMEDLGMGMAQVMCMVRLGDMGLVEDLMLREVDKVEMTAVKKMVGLDVVLALAVALVLVKLVYTFLIMTLDIVMWAAMVVVAEEGKVVQVAVVLGVTLEAVMSTFLIMALDMIMWAARVVVAVEGKVVQVAVDLRVVPEAVLGTFLIMALDVVMQVVRVVVAVEGKVVQVEVDLGVVPEVVLGPPTTAAGVRKT